MSNYSATVVKITNLRPHTNADRLVCTNIFGNNVIVGLETKVGDVGLFFPLESQLGQEFCEVNDLIRRKDENGKPAGGMFDANRRVRCQKFRGERSEGFFIPIDSLNKLFEGVIPEVKEGDQIEEFLGKPISTKYVPKTNPASVRTKVGKKPRESKIIPGQFVFHFDTDQLGRNIHKIHPGDKVVLSWKMHGTSAIASNCLVRKPIGYLLRALRSIGVPVVDTHYDYVYASRRVIKNEFETDKQHFYGEDLWSAVGERLFKDKLHTGETVYYEIVGFTDSGQPIQKNYDYGCNMGWGPKNKAYVYRITRTAPDGSITELQWNQVKERCLQLGVETVPEIFYGEADITYGLDEGDNLNEWQEQFLAFLQMRFVYDQDSQFCTSKVPEEGICLRKEGLNIETYKLKSFRFLEAESKQLDAEVVDMETAN